MKTKTKVIIFFIFAVMILLLTFFMQISQEPEMKLVVSFKTSPPITRGLIDRGISVYYRGVKIGKVSKIRLSNDQMSVLLFLDIFYNDLKLPKNTIAEIGTENILGGKFVDLIYPEKPAKYLVKSGDILKGKPLRVLKKIDEFFENELERGTFKTILTNAESLSQNLNELVKENKSEINPLLKQTRKAGEEMTLTLEDIRNIVGDEQVKVDIKSIINNSSKTVEEISEIVDEIDKERLNDLINQTPQDVAEISENLSSVSKKLTKTDDLLSTTNNHLCPINNAVSKIPPETLENLDKTVESVECLSEGLSDTLSKRFLIWRWLFGKPGSCLEKCKGCKCRYIAPKK